MTKTETETKPELPVTRLVYLGHRMLSTGKIGEAWTPEKTFNKQIQKLTSGVENESNRYFYAETVDALTSSLFAKSKTKRPYIVGGIYEAKASIAEDGSANSINLGGAKYVDRIKDRDTLAGLENASFATDQRKRQADLEKRLSETKAIDSELRALRSVWLKTPAADRTAFELMVLSRMRRHAD